MSVFLPAFILSLLDGTAARFPFGIRAAAIATTVLNRICFILQSEGEDGDKVIINLIDNLYICIDYIYMNFQQLEYILAVNQARHFVTAANLCHVTQATLSMMIRKAEEEVGVKIFDRSKVPVVPTDIGMKIINQAKVILSERDKVFAIIQEEQAEIQGDLRVGIIPTLAPYLLPLFLNDFLNQYPRVNLQINEITTDEITQRLERHDLDVAILAIPLHHKGLIEHHLFYEEFVLYAPARDVLMKKKYILPNDIDVNRLWLLEEGHCLREQVINLCELKSKERTMHQLDFAAGSIETLRRMVEINQGITILPSLALKFMTPTQQKNIRHFKRPAPVRQIGLVTYRYFVKEKLIGALRDTILKRVPMEMKKDMGKEVIEM
jgi:LysR family hydrogen peroxide-inducible transcriptional activator